MVNKQLVFTKSKDKDGETEDEEKVDPLKILMLGPSLFMNGGIASVEKLILQYASSEVKISHISTHEEGSVIQRILIFGGAITQVLLTLLIQEINLVHIHVSQRGSAYRKATLVLLVLIFRKPVILHSHGSEFQIFYSQLNPYLKKILAWIFCKSSRFIVLSNSWKNFYINNLGLEKDQVFVLPNPVKIPQQVPNRSGSNQVNFLFLGRIGQRKGSFDLIKAFAKLPSKQKELCNLIIAGDGDLEQASQLIRSLNLENRITLPGWVSIQQRDTLLAKCDVFVLPSYNEGLPMAVLEAMAWGLPVITTPVGGLPEVVRESKNGLLVNPGDIGKLSEAMKSLIENENFRLDLGYNARISVMPLEIQNYSSSLLNAYRSVLKSYV